MAVRVARWVVVFAVVLAGAALSDAPTLRDGFFGISGIMPDFSYFSELQVACATSGFWIGPSANFVGSNKEALHTRQMRDFVSYGITRIASFYLGQVDASATAAARAIVDCYASRQGAVEVGSRVLYSEVGDEENGSWGTSCDPEEYARRVALVAAGIRDACPDCRIVTGGLLDGAAMGERALLPYLEAFLLAGGGDWIDVYAFHYYGLARPSAYSPGDMLHSSAAAIVDGMWRTLAASESADGVTWARFANDSRWITVLWQDPWVRGGPLWVTPAGEVAVEVWRERRCRATRRRFALPSESSPSISLAQSARSRRRRRFSPRPANGLCGREVVR